MACQILESSTFDTIHTHCLLYSLVLTVAFSECVCMQVSLMYTIIDFFGTRWWEFHSKSKVQSFLAAPLSEEFFSTLPIKIFVENVWMDFTNGLVDLFYLTYCPHLVPARFERPPNLLLAIVTHLPDLLDAKKHLEDRPDILQRLLREWASASPFLDGHQSTATVPPSMSDSRS